MAPKHQSELEHVSAALTLELNAFFTRTRQKFDPQTKELICSVLKDTINNVNDAVKDAARVKQLTAELAHARSVIAKKRRHLEAVEQENKKLLVELAAVNAADAPMDDLFPTPEHSPSPQQ